MTSAIPNENYISKGGSVWDGRKFSDREAAPQMPYDLQYTSDYHNGGFAGEMLRKLCKQTQEGN